MPKLLFGNRTVDMTEGNIRKVIVAFAIPLMLGNLFQQFYNMVDTAVVGQGVGYRALAAVGATAPVVQLFMGLAAFMMSSILLNPQLIIYSAVLGNTALVIRIVSCFLCGAAAGLLIHFFYTKKDKTFFNFSGFKESESRDTDPNLLLRLLKNIWRNIKATGPYFLLGIVLAALFQRYVPETTMVSISGGNRAFGILMAATIGVPLYACGGGTIPLLQQWLATGMSMGSATAFMITGPATKITNLGAMKIILGIRRFFLYLFFTMLFASTTGFIIDILL